MFASTSGNPLSENIPIPTTAISVTNDTPLDLSFSYTPINACNWPTTIASMQTATKAACNSPVKFKTQIVWNGDTYKYSFPSGTMALGSTIPLVSTNPSATPLFYSLSQTADETYGSDATKPPGTSSSKKSTVVIIAVVAAVLLLGGGLAFLMLISRRRSK